MSAAEKSQWEDRGKTRSELMRKYMKSDEGLFFDYDMKNNKPGKIFSVVQVSINLFNIIIITRHQTLKFWQFGKFLTA